MTQTDLMEAETIAAIEDNMVGYYREIVSRWPQVEVHDEANWFWTISDIPYRLFNFVLRPQFPAEEADHLIETSIARCKARGVSTAWKVGLSSRPHDLGERLLAHGFTYQAEVPAMALDLIAWDDQPASVSGLTICEVCTAEDAKVWSRVLTAIFGFPEVVETAFTHLAACYAGVVDAPVRNYLAYLDGEPVATSTVFLVAGVASLYNIGTLAHARGKGVGREVTAAPLRAAGVKGYRLSSLQSTQAGNNLYRRLGFKEYFKYHYYTWSPQGKV